MEETKTNHKKINYRKANILAASGILLAVVMIVIVVLVDRQMVFGDALKVASNGFKGLFSAPSIPPAITPLPSDSETPSESPSSTATNTNSDPVTTCISTFPNCVDKTIRLPLSECSATYCCQVYAGGPWSLYPNQAQCVRDQNNASAQNTTSQSTTTQNSSGQTNNSDTSNYNFVVPTPLPGIQLIACQTSTGTFQLTQDQCTQAQQQDQQTQAKNAQDAQAAYDNCIAQAKGVYQTEINQDSSGMGGALGPNDAAQLENTAATQLAEAEARCSQ